MKILKRVSFTKLIPRVWLSLLHSYWSTEEYNNVIIIDGNTYTVNEKNFTYTLLFSFYKFLEKGFQLILFFQFCFWKQK